MGYENMGAIIEPGSRCGGGAEKFSNRELLKTPVIVSPLEYPNWDSKLANHTDASFFHSSAWAKVLCETYGHNPTYFCCFDRDELKQLLPVMEVSSPLTGRRGVSLPFADFCSPLVGHEGDLSALYAFALETGREKGWRYFESRGSVARWPGAVPSLGFFGHTLPLQASEEALFEGFNGAVRRGIRKASRVGVRVEFGNTPEFVQIFCDLNGKTRRRHGLPSQPDRFFESITRNVLMSNLGFVAIAQYERRPVAAAMFFHHKDTAIFKFGASDYHFQSLRPNNLLMWEAIKKLALEGSKVLDFGRTSLANIGLRRHKLGWGTEERIINYFKYDLEQSAFVADRDKAFGWHTRIFRNLPISFARLASFALYKHFA